MNVRSKAGGGIDPLEYKVDMRRTSIYMTHSVVKKQNKQKYLQWMKFYSI